MSADFGVRAVVPDPERVFGLVAVDAVLNLLPEVPDEALNGPGGRVAQRANGVSLDLPGELVNHVYFRVVGLADLEPCNYTKTFP